MDEKAADRGGIQVIARAATILNAVEGEATGLSLSEISGRVGLPRSTVQRIVAALMNEQLLISTTKRSRVKLGPALARLAASAHLDIEQLVQPLMAELSRAAEETVDLSLLSGDRAIFLGQVLGVQRLVAVSAVGQAFPLHCTANGKAILADLTKSRRDDILPKRLKRYTENTIVDHVRLEEALIAVQANEIAWDVEEHSIGICALGISFRDLFGRSFALSVPVPTARFDEKKDQLASLLQDARRRVMSAIEAPV